MTWHEGHWQGIQIVIDESHCYLGWSGTEQLVIDDCRCNDRMVNNLQDSLSLLSWQDGHWQDILCVDVSH